MVRLKGLEPMFFFLCARSIKPFSWLGCQHLPPNKISLTVLLTLIVPVETGVPRGKPLQGFLGYLAYATPFSPGIPI